MAGVITVPSRRAWSFDAACAMAIRAWKPRSAITSQRRSPPGVIPQDPMISPSHQSVDPMLPARPKRWPGSMPRNQSRFFHPIGVGSRVGSSAAAGSSAVPRVSACQIDPGLAVQIDFLDREVLQGRAGSGQVPTGPTEGPRSSLVRIGRGTVARDPVGPVLGRSRAAPGATSGRPVPSGDVGSSRPPLGCCGQAGRRRP
jgi:hypothetical protein